MINMKIAVTDEQPLGEVVRELERLGYKPLNHLSYRSCHNWIVADCDGIILGWIDASGLDDRYYKPTTLVELKAMACKSHKFNVSTGVCIQCNKLISDFSEENKATSHENWTEIR